MESNFCRHNGLFMQWHGFIGRELIGLAGGTPVFDTLSHSALLLISQLMPSDAFNHWCGARALRRLVVEHGSYPCALVHV